jgi:hypothetical protein
VRSIVSVRKILSTKNYRLFQRHSDDNRPLNLKKHSKLADSMKRYGFLRCFPIVVMRDKDGKLIVKDGQHRLAIAEELGLTVYWVEEEVDFDVAVINCAAKVWGIRDYAQKHAANGSKAYQDGLDFADQHSLTVGTAFALLAGTTSFTNCQEQFIDGTFKIKDRAWAESVAGIYGPLAMMAPAMKNARLIEACMSVCRVADFDQRRLISNAERCREKLVPYSTKEAYLDMLEAVYNFGRSKLVGLKAAAMMAMRERNAVNGKHKKTNGQAKMAVAC